MLVYSNQDGNARRYKAWRYYSPKRIIKNHSAIISRKNFFDHPFDSNTKRYREIGKLTTGQKKFYTTGYLLDYDYIKNHSRLIKVDLSTQKRIRCWSSSNSVNRSRETIKKTR